MQKRVREEIVHMGNNCCKLCNIRLVVFFCLFLLSGCAIPIFKRDGSYVVQAEELRIFPRIFPFFEGPMDFIIIGTNTPVVIGFDLGCGSSLCFNCDEIPIKDVSNEIIDDCKVEVRVMCNLRHKAWQIWRTTQIGKEYNTSYSSYPFGGDGEFKEIHVLKLRSLKDASVKVQSNWYWK